MSAILNIFDFETFINELVETKVSRCYYFIQIYPISEAYASARIILTARTKEFIIRYVHDTNETALRFNENEINELKKRVEKQLKSLLKVLEENGISYSEGVWEI